jgi:hypothetical protein
MPKQKGSSDPFEALSMAYKDEVGAADLNKLKQLLADVAKSEEANQAAMKADEELNQLKEKVKVATEGYSEVKKTNRLKTKFIIRALSDKGDTVAQSIVQNTLLAEMQKSN